MTTEQKIIKTKVGVLELAKQLGNVSQACKVMGYSRDSFYRFKEAFILAPRLRRPCAPVSARGDSNRPRSARRRPRLARPTCAPDRDDS